VSESFLAPFGVKVIVADFLEWNPKMKFDVVIGNPPYQGANASNKLWPKFVEKSLQIVKDGGVVYLITPTTWINKKAGGAWKYFKNCDITHFTPNLLSWFPTVSTNPGAALIIKKPYSGSTTVDGGFTINLHNTLIPVDHKNLNLETIEFLGEMSENHTPVTPLKGDGPNWGDPTLSETPSETHKYETYYASSKKRRAVWSSEPRAGHGELKLIVGCYGNTLKTCEISTRGVGALAKYVTGDSDYLDYLQYLITHPANMRWTALMSSDAWTNPLYWISSKPDEHNSNRD